MTRRTTTRFAMSRLLWSGSARIIVRIGVALMAALMLVYESSAWAQDMRGAIPERGAASIAARHGLVVAQERLAAAIGRDILAQGGNAVDAAVATGFALAVTYPRAGNLGGGGFMLVHLAARKETVAIDYRETAPHAATQTMFLDENGKPDPAQSRDSALGIGVPGTVAGLVLAHDKYGSGRMTLAQLIAPAIALARNGLPVADDIADTLGEAAKRMRRFPASARIFMNNDGSALREGDKLVQSDLAVTLAHIAEKGADGFYRGETANKLIAAIRAAGGIMAMDDLAHYRARILAPVRGAYRGHDIVSMPLPSSGGAVLIETLNMLEGDNLSALSDADRTHLMIEAMKRAYADRARYLGDGPKSEETAQRMIKKSHAADLRAQIDMTRATPADAIQPMAREGGNTTHYSVIDKDGNAVANTTTLNFGYGLGMVADGTGVLLNNELDDFTAAAGASNAYGLVSFEANLPGPGKRPLSSMTPTIVLKDGKAWLVTGSPGGSRIISAVMQVIVNVIDRRMPLAEAVGAPRFHHQWLPDKVFVERGFDATLMESLKRRGHVISQPLGQTSANSLMVTPDGLFGAPDPRTRGASAAGH